MNRYEKFANTAANYYWGMSAFGMAKPTPAQIENVKIIAHRGVHGDDARTLGKTIYENSRESFTVALQNKIWGIEFDVRFTLDNIPVVHHDPHCQRLYHCPAIIEQTTFAEIKNLVPQIPSLDEVVATFGKRIHLLIEIKESLTEIQHQILARTLQPLAPKTDYHLLTLQPRHLKNITFAPKAAIMAVDWMDMASTIQQAKDLNFGAVSGHFMLLNNARLNQCKKQGLITGTGFIETRGAFFREIGRGIDWIFTNHPLRLKAYRA